jgi:heme iron utilization protein
MSLCHAGHPGRNGGPFATLVAVSADARGCPLLLLSDLARHTANLAHDPRASLLLDGSEGAAARLAAPRLTLTGQVARLDGAVEEERRRYLARHPDAERLLGLADFRFYRMVPDAGHLVAGFGRIDAIDAQTLLVPVALARDLAAMEQGAIDHMHADHADAIDLLADHDGARIAALDADGLDLLAGPSPVRRNFAGRLDAAVQLRAAMVEVVRNARKS